jgi:hypothetical protein
MLRRRKWPHRPLPTLPRKLGDAGLPYRRGRAMNLNPVREFLTRCFSSGETIALLLRSEAPDRVTQRKLHSRLVTSLGWPRRMPVAQTSMLLLIRSALVVGSAPKKASLLCAISI